MIVGLIGAIQAKLIVGGAIAVAVVAVLLGARRSGRLAERADAAAQAARIRRAQLDAAVDRPRGRSDLSRRLLDGRF